MLYLSGVFQFVVHLIELRIPYVIYLDFLCLFLLNLTNLASIDFSIDLDIVVVSTL